VSGDNSRVNINSTELAAELAKLRKVLLVRAQSPEHYTAIGAIASAETETKSGNTSNVKRALSALGLAHYQVNYQRELSLWVLRRRTPNWSEASQGPTA
jgi:hypothetical protein